MRSAIAVTIGISVLAYAGTASALESVRQICPKGYAPLAEICISAKTRAIAEQDLHLEYWMEKLYHGTGRTGPEDVSYYSPEELTAAFDGLVKEPSTFAWRGAELFWATKL